MATEEIGEYVMFKAEILADSIHNNNRLVTFELEVPRYIWPEILTHRVFSRNAQSSRAIPNYKLINNLTGKSKVTPIFMENRPGMAAVDPLKGVKLSKATKIWDDARLEAIKYAEKLVVLGVHKQVANRLIEPFSTIKAIVSSTEWDNFYTLRTAPDAQQEMQVIAGMMKEAMESSTPRRVAHDYWHLPLISQFERDTLSVEILKKVSAARCARVSYLNHNGDNTIKDDIILYERLVKSKHCSPLEHIATPLEGWHGNFNGWLQHRQELGL
jgi:thymidylate synthase ThyX